MSDKEEFAQAALNNEIVCREEIRQLKKLVNEMKPRAIRDFGVDDTSVLMLIACGFAEEWMDEMKSREIVHFFTHLAHTFVLLVDMTKEEEA